MCSRNEPYPPPYPSRAERARQLADVVRRRLTEGAFADGWLPDERALARSLGASRNAVREALALLRDEGLITRRRGLGTQVVTPKYGHGLDRLAGLAETLTGYGTVTNEVRTAHVVPHAPEAITERLDLPDGAEAVCLERLRRLGGAALSVDTTWLAADIGRPLLECDLAHRDVFDLIEETSGLRLGRAEITVHAVTADADTARLLAAAALAGTPLGVLLNTLLSGRTFGLLLASAVAVTGVLVWVRDRRERRTGDGEDEARRPLGPFPALAVGVLVSVAAGLFGLGGPMLSVPLLVLSGLPVLPALAAAQAQSVIIAGAGTAGYLLHGSVDWGLALLVGVPELAGVLIGWRIAQAVPTRRLKFALAATLVALAPYLALHS